jgi:hypothetical protein
VEELSSPTCPKNKMMKMDDEKKTTPTITTCPSDIMTNLNDE